ncbi:alpha/beta fold hydrolase [Accumulibacter sp.]|uniref:alpha/beta fold hydrolase n=1 Tax=Accumulibacter sp. TaxID=2053492 RepID=UPI0026032AF5|nr:alpha/beta fold hydrolase [Accumulibacter sp.]
MSKVARSEKVMEAQMEDIGWVPPVLGFESRDFKETLKAVLGAPIRDPITLFKHQASLMGEMFKVFTGKSTLAPDKSDRRFADPSWTENPIHRRMMQAYLANSKYWQSVVDDLKVDEMDRERARFFVSLFVDAFSPTNSLANPAAMKRMLETGGGSIKKGMTNMLHDLVNEGGMPSMVDKTAFKVGENLATTEGVVVFRNDLVELIQYKPLAAQVHERPFFMIPPPINKYYIMDINPEKSMVRYLLQQGKQVFIISWRNPRPEHADWGFDTYAGSAREALLAALEITGAKDCNLWGGCAGGIIGSVMLAQMAARGERLVNSFTLNVTILYMPSDSVMGMMATEGLLKKARKHTAKKGVLDGKEMSRMFAWLRPNDLVWNYWVNNYLMGNKPPAFDLLYWNCDNTRLTSRFHTELMDIVANKWLAHPGEFQAGGIPVDLKKVDCDLFALAGDTDHITPWKSCYESSMFFGGKCEFVLSNSGHIQAMINPPGNKRSVYFTNPARVADADTWLAGATRNSGSWWERWIVWLNDRSGNLVEAPKALGSAAHRPMDPAPGTYVLEP